MGSTRTQSPTGVVAGVRLRRQCEIHLPCLRYAGQAVTVHRRIRVGRGLPHATKPIAEKTAPLVPAKCSMLENRWRLRRVLGGASFHPDWEGVFVRKPFRLRLTHGLRFRKPAPARHGSGRGSGVGRMAWCDFLPPGSLPRRGDIGRDVDAIRLGFPLWLMPAERLHSPKVPMWPR